MLRLRIWSRDGWQPSDRHFQVIESRFRHQMSLCRLWLDLPPTIIRLLSRRSNANPVSYQLLHGFGHGLYKIFHCTWSGFWPQLFFSCCHPLPVFCCEWISAKIAVPSQRPIIGKLTVSVKYWLKWIIGQRFGTISITCKRRRECWKLKILACRPPFIPHLQMCRGIPYGESGMPCKLAMDIAKVWRRLEVVVAIWAFSGWA